MLRNGVALFACCVFALLSQEVKTQTALEKGIGTEINKVRRDPAKSRRIDAVRRVFCRKLSGH